jgi:hypothetical protein
MEPAVSNAHGFSLMEFPPGAFRRLVELTHRRHVIPFVGAGISMSAGLPSWAGLLKMLWERMPKAEGSPATYDEVSKALGGDLSLITEALRRGSGGGTFMHTCRAAFAECLRKKGASLRRSTTDMTPRDVAEALADSRLLDTHAALLTGPFPLVVTTNWDGLFESAWRNLHRCKVRMPDHDSEYLIRSNGPNLSVLYRRDVERVFAHLKASQSIGWRGPRLLKLHGDFLGLTPAASVTPYDPWYDPLECFLQPLEGALDPTKVCEAASKVLIQAMRGWDPICCAERLSEESVVSTVEHLAQSLKGEAPSPSGATAEPSECGGAREFTSSHADYRRIAVRDVAAMSLMRHLASTCSFMFFGYSLQDRDLLATLDEIFETFGADSGPHFVVTAEDVPAERMHFLFRHYSVHTIRVVGAPGAPPPFADAAKLLCQVCEEGWVMPASLDFGGLLLHFPPGRALPAPERSASSSRRFKIHGILRGGVAAPIRSEFGSISLRIVRQPLLQPLLKQLAIARVTKRPWNECNPNEYTPEFEAAFPVPEMTGQWDSSLVGGGASDSGVIDEDGVYSAVGLNVGSTTASPGAATVTLGFLGYEVVKLARLEAELSPELEEMKNRVIFCIGRKRAGRHLVKEKGLVPISPSTPELFNATGFCPGSSHWRALGINVEALGALNPLVARAGHPRMFFVNAQWQRLDDSAREKDSTGHMWERYFGWKLRRAVFEATRDTIIAAVCDAMGMGSSCAVPNTPAQVASFLPRLKEWERQAAGVFDEDVVCGEDHWASFSAPSLEDSAEAMSKPSFARRVSGWVSGIRPSPSARDSEGEERSRASLQREADATREEVFDLPSTEATFPFVDRREIRCTCLGGKQVVPPDALFSTSSQTSTDSPVPPEEGDRRRYPKLIRVFLPILATGIGQLGDDVSLSVMMSSIADLAREIHGKGHFLPPIEIVLCMYDRIACSNLESGRMSVSERVSRGLSGWMRFIVVYSETDLHWTMTKSRTSTLKASVSASSPALQRHEWIKSHQAMSQATHGVSSTVRARTVQAKIRSGRVWDIADALGVPPESLPLPRGVRVADRLIDVGITEGCVVDLTAVCMEE